MSMTPRMLRPVIVKEFRQILRDPTSLGMLLVLPAILIVIVGYALNFDPKHIPFAMFDQNRTVQSRELLRAFQHSEYFRHLHTVFSYREIDKLFDEGKIKVALVVPTSFSEELVAGRNAKIQVLIDGSDNTTSGQALVYAVQIIASYAVTLQGEMLLRSGSGLLTPIDFRPRIWYNPDLVSSQFLIPGLIGFIIMLMGVVSTSMSVVREKERGTMEQLIVSPLKPSAVILGKTIPYLVICLIAASIILLLGYVLFDVVVKGSLLLLYLGILTLLTASLGQGLLISTVTDSQQVAFMLSVFSSLLPSMLLSGFVFPIESMPILLQVLSNLAIVKFFLVAVRGIVLKGVGIVDLWEQYLAMIVFTGIVLGISIVRIRKRGEQ